MCWISNIDTRCIGSGARGAGLGFRSLGARAGLAPRVRPLRRERVVADAGPVLAIVPNSGAHVARASAG
jgi:hypothetical protein